MHAGQYKRHGTLCLTANLEIWCGWAAWCGIQADLGQKGKHGVLNSSWLNQISIWFSILVRKLLKRSSFSSLEDLKGRLLRFIDYFNRTMAKPIDWLYSPRLLHQEPATD
jgi:hypothetical protein